MRPARVTLNMAPELYRELDRWTSAAAEAIGPPRVSIQDALLAMVRGGMRDKAAEAGIRTMRCQSLEWMTARSSLLIFLVAISWSAASPR